MPLQVNKDDTDECNQFIREQVIVQISEIIPGGIAASLALSVLLVLSLIGQVSLQNSLTWLGLIALVSLLRLPVCYHFLRRLSLKPFCSHRQYLLVGIALSGVLWGVTPYFIFADHSPVHQALHIVVLGGLVAGSIVIYAPDMLMFVSFAVPATFPVIFKLFSLGGTYRPIGLILFIFLVFTIHSTKRINKKVIDGLILRFENRHLIKKLRAEKKESLHFNRRLREEMMKHKAVALELSNYKIELEDIVSKRTKALNLEIKERKEYEQKLVQNEEKLAFLAFHDSLTSLPNRSLLKDRLGQATKRADRSGKKLALIFLDLDNFKDINDTLGHDTGDGLLEELARRFETYCRTDDTVARLGGDEFMFLFENISNGPEELGIICERISNGLNESFVISGHDIRVSASMGVTLYPDDGDNIETLIKNSDLAMYQAKSQGKNKFCFFTGQMNIDLQKKIELERDLQKAIQNGELVLFYQPKVNIQTCRITGCEALIRWQKPDGRLIPPDQFIPLAETTGLIRKIDTFVLETAMYKNRQWNRGNDSKLNMAINVSSHQFQKPDFPAFVAGLLKETEQDANDITLEITENMVMEDVENAMKTMDALTGYGVKIAIDDFGTGYSSLSYLKKFPVNILKIDRSFIMDLPDNLDDKMITTSILHLAHNLGLSVVAEGVETTAQLEFLQRFGCEEVQGYLLGRPLPADEFSALLQNDKELRELVAHHLDNVQFQ